MTTLLGVAWRISLPWALVALLIKYLELWGVIDLKVLDFLNTGEIYGGFTFVLGCLLDSVVLVRIRSVQ